MIQFTSGTCGQRTACSELATWNGVLSASAFDGPMRREQVKAAEAKRDMGASMGFAEPHGHVGRQHRRCAVT